MRSGGRDYEVNTGSDSRQPRNYGEENRGGGGVRRSRGEDAIGGRELALREESEIQILSFLVKIPNSPRFKIKWDPDIMRLAKEGTIGHIDRRG